MRPAVEFIVPDTGRDWAFQTRTDSVFGFAWHAHDEYELTIIGSGSGRRFAGDGAGSYEPGDVALYGPRVPHTYASDSAGNQQAYVAHFGSSFVDRWCVADEFGAVRTLLDRSSFGLVLPRPDAAVRSAVAALADAAGPRQTVALVSLLVELSLSPMAELAASPGRAPATSSTESLNTVVSYLEQHYRSPVSRDDLAAAVSMSPSSVSRLLRNQLGTTLTDYVTSLRVAAACRELVSSADAVSVIAYRCGFTNLSNFNRTFRRARGVTPRAYRRTFTG